MTFADLATELRKVGCSLADVTQIRLDGERGRTNGGVWLVVTTACRNDDDKRYCDAETGEMATEVHRFRVATLFLSRHQ